MRKYVNTYRREFEKNGKKHSKAPKIQRLVTPLTLQRKRRRSALKKAKHEKSRAEAAEYHKLLVQVRQWLQLTVVDCRLGTDRCGGMYGFVLLHRACVLGVCVRFTVCLKFHKYQCIAAMIVWR